MKGKHICEELKRIRKEIASRNDIDYTPVECTHEGDCVGVCPTCEREAAYIMEELEKREAAGLPIDWDYNLANRMTDLEVERVRFECSDNAIDRDGMIPQPETLAGMPAPRETYCLEGDVASPENWEEDTEDEDDVDKSKD